MVDESDHVEAIGHDHRIGKLLFNDGAIDRRQIDAHHADVLFAFEAKKIGL